MSLENDIRFILEHAVRAPSADNLQPWRFKVDFHQPRLEFFLDESRLQHYCDLGLLAPYITAGAVLENIRVAARQRGYSVKIKYFPDCQDILNIAEIRFERSQALTEHPHFSAINHRSTNRKFYHPWKKIAEETLNPLKGLVAAETGFQLSWLQNTDPHYSELTAIVGEADQLRFEIERLHQEFISILRRTPQKAETFNDGLDLRTLEAGPMGGFLFWLASSWGRMKILNTLGMSRLFNLYAQMQMRSSPLTGLLTATSNSPLDFLKGGEVMERLWHEAAQSGLSLQPMEALPIFILNDQQNANQSMSESQQKQLKKLKEKFFRIFQINDEAGLILFFRIGYAAAQKVRSKRRPVQSFLIGDTYAAARR